MDYRRSVTASGGCVVFAVLGSGLFLCCLWLFLFVALCVWFCVGRYAFLTWEMHFYPTLGSDLASLIVPPPCVQAFCEFSQRTEPLSRIGRTRGQKKRLKGGSRVASRGGLR